MSFSGGSDSFTVKKFESQNEIEEKKKKRQEQWEKVRRPDDPEGRVIVKMARISAILSFSTESENDMPILSASAV